MKTNQNLTIKISGKRNSMFTAYLSKQAVKMLNIEKASPDEQKEKLGALQSLFHSLKPRTEIEAMLLLQIFAQHNFSMELLHKAQIEKHWHTVDTSMNYANKFSRNCMMLLDALDKQRTPENKN